MLCRPCWGSKTKQFGGHYFVPAHKQVHRAQKVSTMGDRHVGAGSSISVSQWGGMEKKSRGEGTAASLRSVIKANDCSAPIALCNFGPCVVSFSTCSVTCHISRSTCISLFLFTVYPKIYMDHGRKSHHVIYLVSHVLFCFYPTLDR